MSVCIIIIRHINLIYKCLKVQPQERTLIQGHKQKCLQTTAGKPLMTYSLGVAVPLFNKRKCSQTLAAERCCGPPPGLQEAENKDNFHSLRQTGHM